MHKPGHYGLALVLYAPIFAAIYGLGHSALALFSLLLTLWLTLLPDIDMQTSWLTHRGPTHTVWFSIPATALAIGILFALQASPGVLVFIGMVLGLKRSGLNKRGLISGIFLSGLFIGTSVEAGLVSPTLLVGVGAGIGVTSVVAHLIGDVLTPMGIAPFAPVDETEYTLELAHASNRLANAMLLGLGIVVTVAALSIIGSPA